MRRLDLDQARLGLADFDLFCLVLPSSQNKQYQAWVSFSRIFLMNDVPLLIYEVKREDSGDTEAAQQMDRYINWAMQYLSVLLPHASRKIWAVLVTGSKSDVYMMEQGSSIIKITYGLDTTGAQIRGVLR